MVSQLSWSQTKTIQTALFHLQTNIESTRRGSKVSRPKKLLQDNWIKIVENQWKKHRLNALTIEKITRYETKVRIPHNSIHRLMLEKGFASEQQIKQKRRKPWVRYERTHSLSAVHMDWHISRAVPGKQVCVVLDDASRKCFQEESSTVLALKIPCYFSVKPWKTVGRCLVWAFESVLAIMELSFYADKRDKQGRVDHVFENFLKAQGC